MTLVETIEGTCDDNCWFQYDLEDDILYLHLAEHREAPTRSETRSDGSRLLRLQENDQPVGLTILGWWSRMGRTGRPDSLSELGNLIEPLAEQLRNA